MQTFGTFLCAGLALVGTASLWAEDATVTTISVSASMDLYRAGGYDDGSDGGAPAVFTFAAKEGQALTFLNTGTWVCASWEPVYGADGSTTTPCLSPDGGQNIEPIGPFSGYDLTDLVGSLAGVFLEDSLPLSAPPALRFYAANDTKGGIPANFLSLSPLIGQVFFIGNGVTNQEGADRPQLFRVPPTATHLYLGYIDNCNPPYTVPGCYSDNAGAITVHLSLWP